MFNRERIMRTDKYLKVSRLIKRRTVANEACEQGRVLLNGKTAKPAAEVKTGDILELKLGERSIRVEVIVVLEHTMKGDAAAMYKVLQ